MDGDDKKPLKIVISDFYKLHMNKGKEYTFKNFKKFGIKQEEIDQDIVIKMFDHLKGRVHVANQNGLQSLVKF